MPLEFVVLAAGFGKRMLSSIPTVFLPLLEKPMLAHVIDTANEFDSLQIHVVIRPDMQERASELFGDQINWVHQQQPLGTAHAVQQALPHISKESRVVVIHGNAPLLSDSVITRALYEDERSLTTVTTEVSNPEGHDRVSRGSHGQVVDVYDDSLSPFVLKEHREINSGVIVASEKLLRRLIQRIEPKIDQGEYVLTDIVRFGVKRSNYVTAVKVDSPDEVLGIKTFADFAQAERILSRRCAEELMIQGVRIRDPDRFDLRGSLVAGKDCCIDVNVVLEGEVVLGDGVQIGPGCILKNVKVGNNVELRDYSLIESSTLGSGCRVGPLARIRPGSELGDDVHIGNFVEVKNAHIESGSKAGHLAYLGDADIGEDVNVGAGAITCNFDGTSKHRTVIGDNVFIGTNCTLVAPLKVSSGAFLAAGSTITRDVNGNILAVGRARQRDISRWTPPHLRST